ncbi:hypothetical protein MHI57_07155 [Cytobacillus sp. FSL K6-0129]|uniref:hypothetical protein n=1 Tax=Cytobacillus sp. FSL K6-0129 TaxID=2921421 RepID=UPI0030F977C3
MSIPSWLENNKVRFFVVQAASKEVIVCINEVTSTKVVFIEDVHTGKRAFPDKEKIVTTNGDITHLVMELAEQL